MNEIPYPCLVALLGLALLAAGFALSAYRSRHGLGARLARRRLRARLLAVQSIDHPIDRAEVQP